MRSVTLFIIATTAISATSAEAKVKGWIDPDKINGGGAYIASVYENSYSPEINETAITIACEKNGEVTVDLHIGPRSYPYNVQGGAIVTVKFDNQPAFDMTARSFGGKRVIDLLRRSNTLMMNIPQYGSTLEFQLNGASKALLPFKKQCGV